jgi:hypothetical protein
MSKSTSKAILDRWDLPELGPEASAGSAAALCQPALSQPAALIFGITAPHSRLLIGLKGVLKAVFLDRADGADQLGGRDLFDRWSGAADGEEQARLGVAAGGELPPFGGNSERGSGGGGHQRSFVKAFTSWVGTSE